MKAVAVGLLALYLAVVTLAVVATARAGAGDERRAIAALRAEFGEGQLFACFVRIAQRETGGTWDPHAVNWTDRHADGSRGSFGLVQVGALWRRPGESVPHFAHRMFDLRQNLRLAHHLYDQFGVVPWGSC